VTLTYAKLQQLSTRLNMRMSELFADAPEPNEPAVTARRSVGRLDDAVRVNTKNYDYYYLGAELRRKRMIPVYTHIRAKSVAEFGELVRHSGEEFIYVLDGAVEVHTEFYDPVVLHAGESIYIDSNMGHAYIAAEGCDEALVLAVCSSADEACSSRSIRCTAMPQRNPSAVDKPARAKKKAPPKRSRDTR
jgi:mannose-6-phosphate isomerase-like protein (cupin superfamily)